MYDLNDSERKSLDKFCAADESRKILAESGHLVIEFIPTGIGIAKIAKIRNSIGTQIESDITDYAAW